VEMLETLIPAQTATEMIQFASSFEQCRTGPD